MSRRHAAIAGAAGSVRIGQRVRMEITQVADAGLPCFRPAENP